MAQGRDRIWLALWIGAAFVLFGVGLFLLGGRGRPGQSPEGEIAPGAAPSLRTTTLYFGTQDGTALRTEQRDLEAGAAIDAWCAAAIRALIEGPREGDAVRTLPAGTVLHRVFYDEDAGMVYLDFSPTLVTGHPGGTTAEWATLGALVETIGANFPAIARVQILVDQQPVESLGGHFDLLKPIEVATWQ